MSVVEKDLFREVSTFKNVCDYIEDHVISLLRPLWLLQTDQRQLLLDIPEGQFGRTSTY
jgi:hypothetical protein